MLGIFLLFPFAITIHYGKDGFWLTDEATEAWRA